MSVWFPLFFPSVCKSAAIRPSVAGAFTRTQDRAVRQRYPSQVWLTSRLLICNRTLWFIVRLEIDLVLIVAGLSSFQQSVAMDRLHRILGIIQKPEMGWDSRKMTITDFFYCNKLARMLPLKLRPPCYLQWEISAKPRSDRSDAQSLVPTSGLPIRCAEPDQHSQTPNTVAPESAPYASEGECLFKAVFQSI